ncbi:MAG: hypothetical protein AAF805_12950, partial [Planctomycetota bacterium]
FADTFYRGTAGGEAGAAASAVSPFAAVMALPLEVDSENRTDAQVAGEPVLVFAHLAWAAAYNAALFGLLVWLFRTRWRVAD